MTLLRPPPFSLHSPLPVPVFSLHCHHGSSLLDWGLPAASNHYQLYFSLSVNCISLSLSIVFLSVCQAVASWRRCTQLRPCSCCWGTLYFTTLLPMIQSPHCTLLVYPPNPKHTAYSKLYRLQSADFSSLCFSRIFKIWSSDKLLNTIEC